MAERMAEYTYNPQSSPFSSSAVCPTRTDLLNRLADILANLGHAKLELTAAVEDGDILSSQSARVEVEKLRSDCNYLRAELESHRAHHHC